jgi:hypothetical protein
MHNIVAQFIRLQPRWLSSKIQKISTDPEQTPKSSPEYSHHILFQEFDYFQVRAQNQTMQSPNMHPICLSHGTEIHLHNHGQHWSM